MVAPEATVIGVLLALTVTVGDAIAVTLRLLGKVAFNPPGFVTITLRAPTVAPAAIVSVAVSCVAVGTATLLTVMPAPALTVAPLWKLVPVIVIAMVLPTVPCGGLMPVTVGGEA